MMSNAEGDCIVIAVLSGKGGSGKTAISLAISKVLSDAGIETLLIDCDIATRGATYFFEPELKGIPIDFQSLFVESVDEGRIIAQTRHGFDFIRADGDWDHDPVADFSRENWKYLQSQYSVILLDCQAGYSELVKWAVANSQARLIVLEPDAVSAAATRTLAFRLGGMLETQTTFQIFNKLTEEERPIYEKAIGGTLYPSLPPLPFDWGVRASFASRSIPEVISARSAFGLGVLRMLRQLIPSHDSILQEHEQRTVGNWFTDIRTKLTELEDLKADTRFERSEQDRRNRLRRLYIQTSGVMSVGVLLMAMTFMRGSLAGILLEYLPAAIGMMAVVVGFARQVFEVKEIREERNKDSAENAMQDLESQIDQYKTLISTDPRLREYSKENLGNAVSRTRFRSGESCIVSGVYRVESYIDDDGAIVDHDVRVSLSAGENFPLNDSRRCRWKLIDDPVASK